MLLEHTLAIWLPIRGPKNTPIPLAAPHRSFLPLLPIATFSPPSLPLPLSALSLLSFWWGRAVAAGGVRGRRTAQEEQLGRKGEEGEQQEEQVRTTCLLLSVTPLLLLSPLATTISIALLWLSSHSSITALHHSPAAPLLTFLPKPVADTAPFSSVYGAAKYSEWQFSPHNTASQDLSVLSKLKFVCLSSLLLSDCLQTILVISWFTSLINWFKIVLYPASIPTGDPAVYIHTPNIIRQNIIRLLGLIGGKPQADNGESIVLLGWKNQEGSFILMAREGIHKAPFPCLGKSHSTIF